MKYQIIAASAISLLNCQRVRAEQANVNAYLSTKDVGGDSVQGFGSKQLVVHVDKNSISPEKLAAIASSSNVVFAEMPDMPEFVSVKVYEQLQALGSIFEDDEPENKEDGEHEDDELKHEDHPSMSCSTKESISHSKTIDCDTSTSCPSTTYTTNTVDEKSSTKIYSVTPTPHIPKKGHKNVNGTEYSEGEDEEEWDNAAAVLGRPAMVGAAAIALGLALL